MEASISLCQFCENHGPCIMFTCQKIPTSYLNTEVNDDLKDENSSLKTSSQSTNFKESSSDASSSRSSSQKRSSSPCPSCQSIPQTTTNSGFITHDHKLSSSYISNRNPNNSSIYNLIKQACVRSLTGEVCPDNEGSFMFGDPINGYVIAFVFSLRDNHARGKKRTFSLIYITNDRVFAVQSMDFIAKCLSSIAKYLQQKANEVYQNETSCRFNSCSFKSCVFTSSKSPHHSSKDQKSSSKTPRSLKDTVNLPDLYSYLHKAFSWILRSAKERLKEKIFFGRSPEDEIVKMEHDEKDIQDVDLSDEDQLKFGEEFTSLRHIRQMLQPTLFRALLWHLLIGNQVIWRSKYGSTVRSALNIIQKVLPLGCVKIKSFSSSYVNSYCANLLGLSNDTILPNHVKNSQHFVLIDVVSKTPKDSKSQSLINMEFRMTSGCTIPEKLPQLLCKLDAVLEFTNFSQDVVSRCILCYKEEWVNKAKVLYKFARIDNRSKKEAEKLLNVVLGCTSDSDVRLLKYWMTGLSQQFKLNLRQSKKSNG